MTRSVSGVPVSSPEQHFYINSKLTTHTVLLAECGGSLGVVVYIAYDSVITFTARGPRPRSPLKTSAQTSSVGGLFR